MYKSLLKKKLLTALNRHATAYMNITTSLYRKRAMQDISFGIRQSISKGLAKPGVLLFFVVQPYIPAFLLSEFLQFPFFCCATLHPYIFSFHNLEAREYF